MTGIRHIFALVAVLAAISCSKDGLHTIPVDSGIPIEFTSDVRNATKGLDEINTETIKEQKIGLYAFRTGSTVPYLENIKMEYSNTEGGLDYWKSSPAMYWPLASELSFFAYSPYQADVSTSGSQVIFMAEEPSGGMPRIRITPSIDVSEQIDFCIAGPALNRTASEGAVNLSFVHCLTRVRFYANIDGNIEEGKEYRVTSVTLSGVAASNIITYSDNLIEPFIWDDIDEYGTRNGEYRISIEDGQLTGDRVKSVAELTEEAGMDRYTYLNSPEEGHFYLIPQELTQGAKVTLVITTEGADPITIEKQLSTAVAWESGKTVSYLLTLTI